MKKTLWILLFVFAIISCKPSIQENSGDFFVESSSQNNSQSNEEDLYPNDDDSISAQDHLEQVSVQINADTTTLCLGCKTIITSELEGFNDDLTEYHWSTEFGSIEGNGSEVTYIAPNSIFDSYVDNISLIITSGEKEVEQKLPILLIENDQINMWVKTNGPYGGCIKNIEISERDPNILYASGAGGKVYKSIDSGEEWASLGQVDGDAWVGALLLSESDTQTTLLAIQNDQLFVSLDDGDSWIRKGEIGNIRVITKSPENSNQIIAGGMGSSVYKSSNGGQSWSMIGSLGANGRIDALAFDADNEIWAAVSTGKELERKSSLFHTSNGGRNWKIVDFPTLPDSIIWSIYIDPENEIYIGLNDNYNRNFRETTNQHVFHSIDNGENWTSFSLPFADAMVNILGQPSNSEKLYIASGGHVFVKEGYSVREFYNLIEKREIGDVEDIEFHPENENIIYIPIYQGNGIRKSTDGGMTWSTISKGLDNTVIALLASPPNQGNNIYMSSSVGGEGVFVTKDFGENWENVVDNGISHPWLDEIQFSYEEPASAWVVADVGTVFKTTNLGEEFEDVINTMEKRGFKFGSIYAIASDTHKHSTIYALKNGFGIYKTRSLYDKWDFLDDSEIDYTFTLAVHPENPDIVFSGYSPKLFQNFGMIRKSDDGGENWTTSLKLENSDGITSIAIDPSDPDRMYAGNVGKTGEIWTSRNGGDTWSKLNPDLNFTNLHVMESSYGPPGIIYGAVWGGGNYTTVDNGKSWQRLENDPTISASAILLNPMDENEIFICDRISPKVFHTINNGKEWETIFNGGNDYYRVLSCSISASRPEILYVSIFGNEGPFSGDVFRIENGESKIVTGDLPRLPVSMSVDPTNSEIVYSVTHAGAVYKTSNGGEHWENLSEKAIGLPDSSKISFNSILISPFNPKTIYLLAGSDITDFKLTPSGADVNDMYTVYRSLDGGETWENLNNGYLGELSGGIKDIAFNPNDTSNLFLATANGIFMSMNNGNSWEDVSGYLPSIQMSNISISLDGKYIYAATLGGGIISGRITGSGVNWASQSNLIVPIQNIQINVHPEEPNTIFASAYPGGIFKTVDGGISWIECNFGLPSFYVDDPTRQGYYAIKLAPSNPETMYLGIYGIGIYKSEDGGNTWISKNGKNTILQGQHIYSLLIDAEEDNKVIVSSSEGVYLTNDGGENWVSADEGLDENQIRVLEYGPNGSIIGGTLGSEILRLDLDKREEWHDFKLPFDNYGIKWPIWNDRPFYQYTTVLFNPNDPDIILIGTFPAGIYKSIDGGNHFTESNFGGGRDGTFTLVYHPENDQIIYAGTYNGINRSTNQGDFWELWNVGWPAEQWVFSIAFDNDNPDIMYACSKNGENEGQGTTGYHGNVMKSLDAGENWFPIMNGLSRNNEFYKIIVDKFDANILYLASQNDGIFISRDAGESWKPWNDGLEGAIPGTNGNNVTNTMALSNDGTLLILGTQGEGVFRRLSVTFADKWLIEQ